MSPIVATPAPLHAYAAPPRVGPPRWDGYAACAQSWHFAELPAAELARRGCFIEVLRLERADDRARGHLIQSARAPLLVDHWVGIHLAPEALRRTGQGLLYVVDEDLRHPPPWLAFTIPSGNLMEGLEPRLRASDGIVVPTVPLAEWVQEFGKPVYLIPLSLPRLEELPRPADRRDGAGLRVGWAGTASHRGDLDVIGPAVVQLLSRHADLTFVLAGQEFRPWAVHHPQIELHPGFVHLPAYYRWLASLNLDVFVAPLASGQPWNEAKPCLKPLEAAGLGIPVIASAVGASAEELVHEQTALVVANTEAAWSAALGRKPTRDRTRGGSSGPLGSLRRHPGGRAMPKGFRTVLHGTCLLDGKHPPGSKLARECPALRRAGRRQGLEIEGGATTLQDPQEAPSSRPAESGTSNTVFRRVATGRAFRPGRPHVSGAEQQQKARERDRAYRARQRGLTPAPVF